MHKIARLRGQTGDKEVSNWKARWMPDTVYGGTGDLNKEDNHRHGRASCAYALCNPASCVGKRTGQGDIRSSCPSASMHMFPTCSKNIRQFQSPHALGRQAQIFFIWSWHGPLRKGNMIDSTGRSGRTDKGQATDRTSCMAAWVLLLRYLGR